MLRPTLFNKPPWNHLSWLFLLHALPWHLFNLSNIWCHTPLSTWRPTTYCQSLIQPILTYMGSQKFHTLGYLSKWQNIYLCSWYRYYEAGKKSYSNDTKAIFWHFGTCHWEECITKYLLSFSWWAKNPMIYTLKCTSKWQDINNYSWYSHCKAVKISWCNDARAIYWHFGIFNFDNCLTKYKLSFNSGSKNHMKYIVM